MCRFKIGNRVGYTKAFCQTTYPGYVCADIANQIGTVVGFDGRFVMVQWDGGDLNNVLPDNIAKPGTSAFAHVDARGWVGYDAVGEKNKKSGSLFNL